MTTNVVYDHPMQLQENSAYESINVVYDYPMQLQENPAYEFISWGFQYQVLCLAIAVKFGIT